MTSPSVMASPSVIVFNGDSSATASEQQAKRAAERRSNFLAAMQAQGQGLSNEDHDEVVAMLAGRQKDNYIELGRRHKAKFLNSLH
jgi:hypothetical protein